MANARTTKEKIILFPTAIDHYQVQLIYYLETERYSEAFSLLKYLEQFSVDEQTSKEWHVLMTWLRGTIDESDTHLQHEEWSEEQIFQQIVQDKMQQEEAYTSKLLDTLMHTSYMEKQLLALEQLTVIEHPEINRLIINWLTSKVIHPLVQFKALQVLKNRGQKGVMKLYKNGQYVECLIEQTPLQFNQFPLPIRRVLNKVIDVSETRYASIGFFAEELWNDFISHNYATSIYYKMANDTEQRINVWASVLHHVVLETLQMTIDYNDFILLYGINPENDEMWRKSYILIKNFVK